MHVSSVLCPPDLLCEIRRRFRREDIFQSHDIVMEPRKRVNDGLGENLELFDGIL
jgi:hypothetical protein